MEQKKLSWIIGLCVLVTASQCQLNTSTSDSDNCCIKEAEKDIIDSINYENVTNEEECKKLCNSRDACVRFNWIPNECKMLTIFSKVKLGSLVNCADGNISYCWNLKVNVHTPGGSKQAGVKNETDCKRFCIGNLNCIGVDWNHDNKTCWVLPLIEKPTQNHKQKINHWIIERNVPITFKNNNYSIQAMLESTTDCTMTTSSVSPPVIDMHIMLILLGALLGAWTLIIIAISICAMKLKKCCSTQKKVDEVKMVDVDRVDNREKDDIGEATEDDAESYVDYQDLRRVDDAKTYETACEYTAMELEDMKDDDNVYYNEDQ